MTQYMKDVHKLKQGNELGRNEAGIRTSLKFSWENSARKIIDYLKK